MRRTSKGTPVASFSLAANRKYKANGDQQEETAFVNCALFGPPAEWLGEHRKGEKLAVSGRLRSESWESDGSTRWRLVLVVEEIDFYQRGTNGPNGGAGGQPKMDEATRKAVPF
jgi:single-strand DNA-binding protein